MSVSASVSLEIPVDVHIQHLYSRIEALERRLGARKREEPQNLDWQFDWMPTFLEVLEKTGVVSKAIRAVKGKANRGTVYKYNRRCPRFRERWVEALAAHAEDLP